MTIRSDLNKLISKDINKSAVAPANNYQSRGVIRNNSNNADPTDPKKNGGLKSPITLNILTTVQRDILGDGSVLVEDAATAEMVDADGNVYTITSITWPP